MDTLNVVLKTGYKIVKDFSDPHKPVSNRTYVYMTCSIECVWVILDDLLCLCMSYCVTELIIIMGINSYVEASVSFSSYGNNLEGKQ